MPSQGVRCNRNGVDRVALNSHPVFDAAVIRAEPLPEAAVASALAAVDWCQLPWLTQLELQFNVACLSRAAPCVPLPPQIVHLGIRCPARLPLARRAFFRARCR